ncbi:aldo/keto reductase [Microvenator marinus]|uniref:Aldo/keto reductase n=1 Tax=Microvenator marinus TaxID=2600177 RepID=A0A5B8Y158_9DELT|nr:aldo/keto reductase [Microvenator marinus]QED30083.1 aldo/keto reductase [Microvenator marinus]
MKRRDFLILSAANCMVLSSPTLLFGAQRPKILTKPIHSTGEAIPVIGMGTWQTFNVGTDTALMDSRTQVLSTFLEAGGTVVDSSPMYGSAQNVMGYALSKLNRPKVFSADKIWTRSGDTAADLNQSGSKWGVERFDLMQVHNLLNWEEHLPRLLEMKKEGKIRYVGITTSHGRRHSDFESVMKRYPLDFVQLTYNVDDREVERRLLPLAKDRNIAVLANRPFQGGTLPDQLKGRAKLPDIAKELGCTTWPQLLLKWVVSHPAVTCAIPATSKVEHMKENMVACTGTLPDQAGRDAILKAFEGA